MNSEEELKPSNGNQRLNVSKEKKGGEQGSSQKKKHRFNQGLNTCLDAEIAEREEEKLPIAQNIPRNVL